MAGSDQHALNEYYGKEVHVSIRRWRRDRGDPLIPRREDRPTEHHGQSRFFNSEPTGTGNALDEFVADVTTIAQSRCERATDYADIETLFCRLPIDHLTFAAHDTSAPYS